MLDALPLRRRWMRARHSSSAVVAGVLVLVALVYVFSRAGSAAVSTSSSSPRAVAPGRWYGKKRRNGLAQYEQIFFFGDSWTANGFDLNSNQPDRENPIGNPDFPGDCSSNGPNWVSFLTGTYNTSFIRSFDIAHGASTIDRDLVMPLFKYTSTMREQVEELFGKNYLPGNAHVQWEPENTLFALWSGIVDISLLTRNKNSTEVVPAIMKSYRKGLDKLYHYGARHFLLLNMPPLNRAPNCENPLLASHFVYDFNHMMHDMRADFARRHPAASVKLFDTGRFFTQILEDPRDFPQITGMVRNFTDWCVGYNDLWGPTTPAIDTYYPQCGVAVNQYFWLNTLHPGYAVHNATAYAIVRDCMTEPLGEFCQ